MIHEERISRTPDHYTVRPVPTHWKGWLSSTLVLKLSSGSAVWLSSKSLMLSTMSSVDMQTIIPLGQYQPNTNILTMVA